VSVKTTAGPVELARPKLRGTGEAFASRLFGTHVARASVCVLTISSTSCDQAIFVDQTTDASVFSDAVQVEIGRLG